MNENNTRIAYKAQTIWTAKSYCDLLLLLLTEESSTAAYDDDRQLYTYLVKKLRGYYEADLNSILAAQHITGQMEKMLVHIITRIKQADKQYCYHWRQQLFSHYLASDPSIDKKTAGRLLAELPDMTDPAISQLLHKVLRLIRGEYIFETVPVVTFEQLTGRWQATADNTTPQYDINFNMLDDLSPSSSPIVLSVQPVADTFSLQIDIPVTNWATRSTGVLQWIAGTADIKEGCIFVQETGRAVCQISVIELGADHFDTFLFHTELRFKKI